MSNAPSGQTDRQTLRLGFAGTPEFAATVLAALLESEHDVAVVYTQPDRPTGRGRKLTASPVKTLAEHAGVPVEQPPRLRGDEAVERLASYDLDALIVAAYGLLLPVRVLTAPTFGCVNVHASLLPRWRGAAPIERALLAGDDETGVAIMAMEKGLDTGPVYADASLPIEPDTTAAALHISLAHLGADVLLDVLRDLPDRTPTAQDDALATLAPKIGEADSWVDFALGARQLDRQVRALAHRQPPMVEATDADGRAVRMRLLEVALADPTSNLAAGQIERPNKRSVILHTGNGALALKTVSLNTGKGSAMPIAAAVNGYAGLFADGAVWRAVTGGPEASP